MIYFLVSSLVLRPTNPTYSVLYEITRFCIQIRSESLELGSVFRNVAQCCLREKWYN